MGSPSARDSLAVDERDSEIDGDDAGSSSAGDHAVLDHQEERIHDLEKGLRRRGVGRRSSNGRALYIAIEDGREDVVESLLAQGVNPDPAPPFPESSVYTPIAAAIGGRNPKIVALLALDPRFDPTRRVHGFTYAQIAEMRRGPKWKEEVSILEEAYDRYEHAAEIRGVNNETTGKLEPELEESSKTPPK